MHSPLQFVRQRVPLLRELPAEVTAISAIAFCVALGFGIVAPAIPAFAREFGVSALAASAVVSVFAATRMLSAPPATAMLKKYSERGVLTAGLVMVAVSSFAAGLSQNYEQLLILRGMGGLGSTMFSVASLAMLMRVVEAEQRGRASAAWSGGFLTGGLAGPAVGGIFTAISLRAPFFVYAATLTAGALVSWFGLRHAHLNAGPAVATDPETDVTRFSVAMKNRAYRAAISMNFGTGFVRFGILSAMGPLFVVEALNSSASMASLGFLASAIGQALFLSRAGKTTDFTGRKKVLLIGGILTTLAFALITAIETLPVFFISMTVLGIAGAYLSSAPTAVVGDVSGGKPRGSMMSAYQMSADFGAIFGPVIAGYLLDQTGSFVEPFAMAAIGMALLTLTVLRMPETLKSTTVAS